MPYGKQLDHGIDFDGIANHLNHQVGCADIHDGCAECLDNAHNFRSGRWLGFYFDQGEFLATIGFELRLMTLITSISL